MKKAVLFLCLTMCFFSCSNENVTQPEDQACDNGTFVGDVLLSTQQEVDEFGAMCYTRIEGTLGIGAEIIANYEPTDISDLTALRSIKQIEGGLQISGNPLLTDLNGLENLALLNGIGILIYNCQALTNLLPLQGITSTENLEFVSIYNNDALISIEGLEGLSTSEVRIYGNNSLISLKGFPQSENMHKIEIENNLSLVSMEGMEYLVTVEGRFLLQNNASLTSLLGLDSLQSVNWFVIEFNEALTTLKGVNVLLSIDVLSIYFNLLLTTNGISEGLSSVTQLNSLYISDNEMVTSLDFLNSEVFITNLLVGNDNIETLESLSNNLGSSMGSIYVIQASNLVSLEGLEAVSTLEDLYIMENDKMLNLKGVENLISVSQDVRIGLNSNDYPFPNNQLTDFCALENLFNNGAYNIDKVYIQNNAYNPTIQDIIDGNCSQ